VGAGYDTVAEEYAHWSRAEADNWRREQWVAALGESLPGGGAVLDLGCGTGAQVAAWVERGLAVTGVDLSRAHVERARRRLPGARFLCTDMAALELPAGGFDAVTAFYSLIHLPRGEQPGLMRRVHGWLRPGGVFLGNLAARAFGALYEPDWLGAPMFWSSLGSRRAQQALKEAGFTLLGVAHADETNLGRRNRFLWFLARKDGPDPVAGGLDTDRLLALFDAPGEGAP
jgi:SAM-dependent methyltransferase